MKVKIASNADKLDAAPWREFAGHIETGCRIISESLTRLRTTMEAAECAALIDAVEQQVAAWEDC